MSERQATGWVMLREALEGGEENESQSFHSKNSIEYAKTQVKGALKSWYLEMRGQNPRGPAEMVARGYLEQMEAWGKG